jgi:inosine-uridine nucleoside N-ribohydrolase
MTAVPCLLDVDTGIDDALAVMLASGSPVLRLAGVTTVAGNVPLDAVTRNTRAVLELLKRDDVPVAVGAAEPLSGWMPREPIPIHGHDGLGDSGLLPARLSVSTESAPSFIARMAEANAHKLVVVATGPLTNIAIAMLLHPQALARVKEIVWMGGAACVPGNVTPVAEFNAWADPQAAAIVLGSAIPITMVGLDVTHKVILESNRLDRMDSATSPASRFAGQIGRYYLDFLAHRGAAGAGAMHDPLAVAVAANPSLVETLPMQVRVETESRFSRGQTICFSSDAHRKRLRLDEPYQERRPEDVRVAVTVDVARFWDAFDEVFAPATS